MKLFTLMKGIFGKPAPAPESEVENSADGAMVEGGTEYTGFAGTSEPLQEEVFATPAAPSILASSRCR